MNLPDLPALQTILIQAVLVCVFVGFLVARFVGKAATRLALLVALVAVAGGIWYYRGTLDECRTSCDCRFFGKQIRVPTCPGQEEAPRKKII